MSFLEPIFNFLRFNKKNWKAVVLCLFAATVFWFFNALNKSYTSNISFPLAFDFSHSNYVAVKPLPQEIRINVTGIGWNLFRRSIGIKVPPLVIPLDRPSEVKKIVGGTLPALFANQLEGMEINFVITDTIYLNIQPKAGRWIKLGLDSVDQYIKKDYTITSDVKIIPDSIFIEGPINVITHFTEPVNLTLDRNNIDENFRRDTEVVLPENNTIRRNPPTVVVDFNVDKLVAVNDSIQLELINIPPGVHPFIGDQKIPCKLAIPESSRGDYKREQVKATLDLKGLKKGERKILPVLQGLPPYSKVLEVDSIHIKF